ncbi:hypothetical protein DPMN_103170 [Dreissena polymorpha]|uniref:Uncharacterized protein n=1 Tax=Dreissena polymorpha TaxID=45954 RepID=A0A9D4K0J6_DREPO|nr:hypothetical protein DPMN_103170 [Dreissena polymorpha]
MTLHPGDSCVNNWMLKAMAKDSGFLKHKRITNHSVRKFLGTKMSIFSSGLVICPMRSSPELDNSRAVVNHVGDIHTGIFVDYFGRTNFENAIRHLFPMGSSSRRDSIGIQGYISTFLKFPTRVLPIDHRT